MTQNKVTEKYRNSFEHKCFQLIIEAYHTALSKKIIQLDWNENDISKELHNYICDNQLRKRWKISTNLEAHIVNDTEKIKGFADKSPRIDFRFTSFIKIYEFEYFFEAKNLKHNKLHRYIKTGIDNFVSEKYKNGSMLGYLLEGTPSETQDKINKLLEKDNRISEILLHKFHQYHNYYYESQHQNIGILKHLIFDFTKNYL